MGHLAPGVQAVGAAATLPRCLSPGAPQEEFYKGRHGHGDLWERSLLAAEQSMCDLGERVRRFPPVVLRVPLPRSRMCGPQANVHLIAGSKPGQVQLGLAFVFFLECFSFCIVFGRRLTFPSQSCPHCGGSLGSVGLLDASGRWLCCKSSSCESPCARAFEPALSDRGAPVEFATQFGVAA